MSQETAIVFLTIFAFIVGIIFSLTRENETSAGFSLVLTMLMCVFIALTPKIPSITKETKVVVEPTSDYRIFNRHGYIVNGKIETVNRTIYLESNSVRDSDELEITIVEVENVLLTPVQALLKPDRYAKITVKTD